MALCGPRLQESSLCLCVSVLCFLTHAHMPARTHLCSPGVRISPRPAVGERWEGPEAGAAGGVGSESLSSSDTTISSCQRSFRF